MGCTEGIIDIDISKSGKLLSKAGVICLLLRVKA